MGEHGLVGLEDHGVFVGIAVKLLGNGRQRIATHHVVELRLRLGVGHAHEVLDAGHAGHVAAAQGDFFFGRLRWGITLHSDFALGGVVGHLHVAHAQILRGDVGRNGLRGFGVELVLGRRSRRGRLGFFAAKQFFARILDETEQTHVKPPRIDETRAATVAAKHGSPVSDGGACFGGYPGGVGLGATRVAPCPRQNS